MKKEDSKLFEVNKRLEKLVKKIINVKIKQISKKKHFFAIFALAKAYKTHHAILILCRKRYGEDSAILARSIFEILINMLYILKDPTDARVDRFFDHDWVARHKMFMYAKTKPALVKLMEEKEANPKFEQITREVEKNYKRVMKKYSYDNRGWSNKSIYDMAIEVGRMDAYRTAYKLQTQFSHSATRTMNDYIKTDGKSFFVQTGSSDNWVNETLVAAFDFLYFIAAEYDKLHELGYNKRLNNIAKEWTEEVGLMNKN